MVHCWMLKNMNKNCLEKKNLMVENCQNVQKDGDGLENVFFDESVHPTGRSVYSASFSMTLWRSFGRCARLSGGHFRHVLEGA